MARKLDPERTFAALMLVAMVIMIVLTIIYTARGTFYLDLSPLGYR